MQPFGEIIATLNNGNELKVTVYKAGRAVELHFLHPKNERSISILVHPLNISSPEGWMHEINVQFDQVINIVKWHWKD